jgi:hypothetical protein
VGFWFVMRHHLRVGPADLRASYERHAQRASLPLPAVAHIDTFYYRPYRWYLGYSLINFLVIGVPVLVIGVYAVSRDMYSAIREHHQVVSETATATNCAEIHVAFRRYFDTVSDSCERYTWFTFGLSLLIAYEKWIGGYAITRSGKVWELRGWILASVYLFGLVSIVYNYGRALRSATATLSHLDCDIRVFTSEGSIVRFIFHLTHRYFWLIVAIALVGGNRVVEKILKL